MIVCIIQARMGSERLPGKILKELCGKPILFHVVNRLRAVEGIDKVVVATTVSEKDNVVVDYCNKLGVDCYRGSEADVLERYHGAAQKYNADIIIRATCDNPLVDINGASKLIEHFVKSGLTYGYMSDYPLGGAVEIFTRVELEEASKNATTQREHEHVTPYMQNDGKEKDFVSCDKQLHHLRFTVDTPEDYKFMSEIYNNLYTKNELFSTEDVLKLLEEKPELLLINKDIIQRS